MKMSPHCKKHVGSSTFGIFCDILKVLKHYQFCPPPLQSTGVVSGSDFFVWFFLVGQNFCFEAIHTNGFRGWVTINNYRTCQLNLPPRKILETLRTGHFFIFLRPYMMSKIHKKQNFVILSGMDLP